MWNKTKKKFTVKFLTDPDSNLGYKDCRDVGKTRGDDVKTNTEMEVQEYCIGEKKNDIDNATELQN